MLGWIPDCAMIYDTTEISDPIRQGDIFTGLARVEIDDLYELPIMTDDGILVQSWLDLSNDVEAVVSLRSVTGIVISQDCDAARAQDISFCEIRPFHDVERDAINAADTPKKWVRLI